MMEGYRTVKQTGSAEVTVQRSRFLAQCVRVCELSEVAGVLEAVQKKYWDASHHCYAYVLGEEAQTTRFSDAGEPGGTAGMPILGVLSARSLTNVLLIVTRYFGGILLGANGLIRAYSHAAAEAVNASGEVFMRRCRCAHVVMPYELLGKVQYLLHTMDIEAVYEYGAQVTARALVPADMCAAFERNLTEATGGRLQPQWKEQAYREQAG